ncbi:MAG: hypothetical protein AAF533_05850 [Acidobacteriota bacterium]
MSPEVTAALSAMQSSVLSKQAIGASACGKAYQSVAQSGAIAVQDGTDYLRYVEMIAATSIGVALAQIAADEPQGQKLLKTAQKLVPTAAKNFQAVGKAAAAVVNAFPRS